MSLRGDFGRLAELRRGIRSLDSRAVREAARDASDVVVEEYQAGFAEQSDPYGGAWATSPHNMVLSGALANPLKVVSGLKIQLKLERHGVFHQAGAHGMATRRVVPDGEGSRWDDPIADAIEASVEKRLPR